MPTPIQVLSEYASAAAQRNLPEDVSVKAKQHILDTFAAILSGSRLLPGTVTLNSSAARAARRKPAFSAATS